MIRYVVQDTRFPDYKVVYREDQRQEAIGHAWEIHGYVIEERLQVVESKQIANYTEI